MHHHHRQHSHRHHSQPAAARWLDSRTRPSRADDGACGGGGGSSFVYMAPEFLRDGTKSEKCDVYSFACCLAEILTGAFDTRVCRASCVVCVVWRVCRVVSYVSCVVLMCVRVCVCVCV
jgi:hypothetical protein